MMTMVSILSLSLTFPITSALAKNKNDNFRQFLAQNNSSNDRPGWGYGDKNHNHTGPPGQSVHPGNGHVQFTNEQLYRLLNLFINRFFGFLNSHS